MARAQEILYAVVGAGDIAFEKVRGARNLTDGKAARKFYADAVKRGRTVTKRIRSTRPSRPSARKTTRKSVQAS